MTEQPGLINEDPIDAEDIYKAYPRKVGKKKALKAIEAAMRVKSASFLLERTRAYAASAAGQRPAKGEEDYRPHPTTWFNGDRYMDDDSEWQRGPKKVEVPAADLDRMRDEAIAKGQQQYEQIKAVVVQMNLQLAEFDKVSNDVMTLKVLSLMTDECVMYIKHTAAQAASHPMRCYVCLALAHQLERHPKDRAGLKPMLEAMDA